jgi:hypothetical protein
MALKAAFILSKVGSARREGRHVSIFHHQFIIVRIKGKKKTLLFGGK